MNEIPSNIKEIADALRGVSIPQGLIEFFIISTQETINESESHQQ